MLLDPRAKALLDMVNRVGAPRFHELDVGQARRAMLKLQDAFQPDAPAVASVLEVPIARAHARDGVLLARAYRPLGAGAEATLPVLLYCHGGGWCIGSVDTHDVFCRQLANACGAVVLSVDYRLAPEHPFPAAVDDAWAAYDWVLAQAGAIGGDATRLIVGGDSAGGTLAIASALRARAEGLAMPRLQVLIYPCAEAYSDRPSRELYAQGYMLDRETLAWFFERYLTCPGDAMDWRISPLLAADLAGLPPTSLVTAGFDPLVDDCLALAEALEGAGVAVRVHHHAGMLHGFITLGRQFPQAAQAIAQIAADVRSAA